MDENYINVPFKFKYILCFYSIKPAGCRCSARYDLNTSYVSIQFLSMWFSPFFYRFKYILCFYSIVTFPHFISPIPLFKYILCFYSIMKEHYVKHHNKRFKYILCFYSIFLISPTTL